MDSAPKDSARWVSPQGNITGMGIVASYSAKFWAIVVILGVISGASAALLVGVLRLVERVSYGVHRQTLLASVEASPGWRRIAALLVAAVIVAVGLRVLGRSSTGGTEVSEAIWLRSGQAASSGSIARGLLSIVTVGMGVSLGREAAPQLFGAATAQPAGGVGRAADLAAAAARRRRRRRGLRRRLQRPARWHAARAGGDARNARAAARRCRRC